ncbi:hypothetical protein JCM10213_006324 [Rhodosporidiobolus nylandii]
MTTPAEGEKKSYGGEKELQRPPSIAEQEQAEQQAENEISEEQAQDELLRRQDSGSGISGWLWKGRGRKGKVGADRDEEASSTRASEDGWKIQPADARLLPIISGLACPFSVLLDIPGLTEQWYVRTENDIVVERQHNPAWLDASLAVSLALGLIANLALIWRFLEHRPKSCTWVSMVSLTLHDIINVLAVIIFAVAHRANDGFSYGSAFWLTLASTATSLVCNFTLALDLFKTKDFGRKGSGLTEKQRTLVIACMALLLYIGLGALLFHYLILDIDFIDSLYFTICTITSVGFGDIVPMTVGSRVFSYFYDPIGLVLVGFNIAVARECLIESFEESYRHRRDQLARKARERKEEKKRRHKEQKEQKALKRKAAEEHARAEGEAGHGGRRGSRARKASSISTPSIDDHKRFSSFHGVDLPLPADDAESPAVDPRRPSAVTVPTTDALAGDALYGQPPPTSAVNGTASSRRWSRLLRPLTLKRTTSSTSPLSPTLVSTAPTLEADSDPAAGARLRRSSSVATTTSVDDSFRQLKRQLHKEQRAEFQLKLGISIVLFLIFWLVGAAVFEQTEQWTYFEGMWFGFVYFTTIGYGDLSPKTAAGRAFFVCWSLLGIANMTLLISVLTESFSSRYKSTISEGRFRRTLKRVTPVFGGGGGGSNGTGGELAARSGNSGTAAELLASEGFEPMYGGVHGTNGGPLDPNELPQKVVETLKGFHSHARFFMLGRTGDTPPNLRFLLDAADTDTLDERLPKVLKGGATSLADAGPQSDMKQYLFMIAYERQFDHLVDTAEHLSNHFANTTTELASLRADRERLEAELAVVNARMQADAASAREMEERDRQHASKDEHEHGQEDARLAFANPFSPPLSSPTAPGAPLPATGARTPKRPIFNRRRSSENSISTLFHPKAPLARLATSDVDLLGPARRRSSTPSPSRTPGGSARSSISIPEDASLDYAASNPFASSSASCPSSGPPSTTGSHSSRIHLPHPHLPHVHLPHPHMPHLPRRKSSLSFVLPPEHAERERGRRASEGDSETPRKAEGSVTPRG